MIAVGLLSAVSPVFAGFSATTPEPSSALLIGGGLGAIILVARWKRSHKK